MCVNPGPDMVMLGMMRGRAALGIDTFNDIFVLIIVLCVPN